MYLQKIVIFLLFLFSFIARGSSMIDQVEKIHVNNSDQYVLYRSSNVSKPVLLFVHGGPGSPLMLFSRAFDKVFMDDFIVVHWDQRNTGKSYNAKSSIDSFSAEQVAKDGLVIVEHLKKKFNRSKIILVGHSWGSIIGSLMVKKQPEDFKAYISVGTVVDMAKGDLMKYEFLQKEISKRGSKASKGDLVKMGPPPWRKFSQLILLSGLMAQYKGNLFNISSEQINSAAEKTKEYSQQEMKNLSVSMGKIWSQIQPFLENYNALKPIPTLNVPLFFAQGTHDMATPTVLAKDYFQKISAPKGKEWVEFSNSAHFPMYEEPAAFLKLLKRVVD